MKPYVWLDDKVILAKPGKFPFFDEGFLCGQGLFETMRTYSGKVFLLEKHIRRLIGSCPTLDIKAPSSVLLKKAVEEVIKKNKLNSAYVRLNVYKKNKDVGIFVFAKDKKFYAKKDYDKGFSAAIIRDLRQDEASPLAGVKSLNRYFYVLLGEMASNLGADEAIILNSKGSICEGSRSNIFTVKKGVIFTPPVDSGCLAWITREVVIEIAGMLKLDLFQIALKPSDLLSSDEAFATNSLIEVMPLTKVDARIIGRGKIGSLTKLILEKYRSLVYGNYK